MGETEHELHLNETPLASLKSSKRLRKQPKLFFLTKGHFTGLGRKEVCFDMWPIGVERENGTAPSFSHVGEIQARITRKQITELGTRGASEKHKENINRLSAP